MDVEPDAAGSPPSDTESRLRGLVDYTHWIYALHSLSVLSALLTTRAVALRFAFGLPSIVAVIMNYARRSETHGTWLESHFRWQIRTFWYAWLWILVSLIIAMPLVLLAGLGFFVGLLGLGLVGLWVIYRIVRGWLSLRDGRSMPVLPPLP
ncbi:MAG TPA: hypothetical protein VN869_02750 [Steroidobacteraceae bacterium]|nr:hypothetical protein [Steroidobacteraceae bacterium]